MAIAAKSKLLVSVLAAVLALAAMGIFTMSPARASEAQVATWTALKAAVEGNTGDITIALTADLYADETVTISSGKNVTLTGGHTIYRKTGAESFLSSFKVEQGGTLNMGTAGSAANQCVNMSGLLLSRTWEMKPAKALTDMKPNDGRQFVILSPESNNNALFFFDKHSERIKDFSLPSYNLEPTDSATITEADFWQISRTLLEVKEQNTNSGSLWGGWGHKLYNPTTGKYFALDSNKAFYGYGVSEPDRAGYDYWFNTQVDRNYWYLRDNQRHNTYVNFNFDANLGYNIVEGQVWNNSLRLVHLREMVEKERELLPHKYAAEELGVDQTTKGGFFINNEGGTVNVSCGTFSDFTTDELPTPKQIGWDKDAEVEGDDWSVAPGHIAPIYNSGSSAQFTMTGGTITKNIVGMNDRRDSNKCRMPLGEDGYLTYEDVRAMAIADGDADQALTRLGRKDWEFKASGNPCLMNFGTRSAGALILNEGAKGRIEGAALIDDNKGDAGAIIVHKSTLSLNDGAKITNNSGLYLGGAINVNSIDGMGVTMNGGEIAFNHSALEGAVTAHGPAGVTGGTFVMNGGSIHDNDTLDKGGAIRVASNGVQLNNGDIYNNRSWVMGGAIYVNGDTPRNSRTLVVNNGSIHDNHAVGSPSDTFVEGSGGAYADKTVDALKTPDDSKVFNYATKHGFEPGTGGGTWICPFGTLIFDGANVVIDDNSASNTGTDFFKETGLGGVLVPVNLAGWLNEETGAPPADNTTIAGQISLLNADEGARSSKGVKIHNNTSRRGGGIGGNGTLLFGTSADQEREHASLDFEKKFADGVEPPAEPLQFKMKTRASDGFVTEVGAFKLPTEAGSWKIHLEIPTDVVRADGVKERLIPADLNNGDEVQGFNDRFLIEEVNADGTRRSDYDFALGKVTVTRTETTTQNTTSTDASGATHSTTITFKDTQLAQTATNTKPKETRPTPAEVVLKAGKVLQDSGASGEEDATAEYRNKFIFELKEKLANGSTVLVSTAKNALDEGATVAFPAITYTAEGEHTYLVSEVKGSLNGIIYSKAVYEVKVNVVKENGTLKATVTGADGSVLPDNKVGTFQNRKDGERPALEKYVDKGVHSDLAAFDAPFEYDIMAYVPVDADRVVVEDSLVDSLKFVSSADEVSAFAMGAENNHLDTVKNDGTKIDSATAGIDGQKLTVTIPDATAYRGQWVRVNFRAVIDAATRATIESFGADWAEIAANAPVLIDAKHAGVKNAASYRVFVKNPDGTFPQYPSGENPGDPNGGGDKPKYEGESNTVTVTPPTQELAVAKAWANADGSSTWPADVASVTLDVYSVKDGAETKVEGRSAILTAGEPAKTLAGLPKLEGVEYIVKESGAESGEVLLNGKTYTVTVSGSTVTNTEKPTTPDTPGGDRSESGVEKYVDKGVHSDLAAFDAPFEYDIMAYVPVDADRVVVEDSLVDSLKFVSSADEVSAFAMGAENNHLDTVKNDGTKIDSATAGIDGQKLTVTIPDATAYRGQWVRVNFRAVIDAATRATIESFGADWAEIAANAPVLIDAKHAGVKNAASYRVFVKNPDGTFPQYPSGENPGDPNGGGDKPKYKGESNTVTVTPPTQELAVAKAWANADGSSTWPADVASVTLDVYSVKDGAETKVEGRSAILTAGEPAKTLAGLPKLEGVEYIVKESGAESGEVLLNGKTYTVTVSGSTVTNTEKPTTPDTPGGDEPNNPGGDEPNNPGGDEPNNPGGDEPNNPGGDEPNNPGGDEPNNPGGDEPNNPGGDKPNTPGDGGLAKTGFALGGVSLLTGGMLLLGTALLGAKRRREG